jgi:hypothetical protein
MTEAEAARIMVAEARAVLTRDLGKSNSVHFRQFPSPVEN